MPRVRPRSILGSLHTSSSLNLCRDAYDEYVSRGLLSFQNKSVNFSLVSEPLVSSRDGEPGFFKDLESSHKSRMIRNHVTKTVYGNLQDNSDQAGYPKIQLQKKTGETEHENYRNCEINGNRIQCSKLAACPRSGDQPADATR